MPLQEISPNIRRPGPKPKPLAERPYKPSKSVIRIQRSYSREKKICVLQFLLHHRIPRESNEKLKRSMVPESGEDSQLRAPTIHEASKYFRIPPNNIARWYRNQDKIVGSAGGSRQTARQWISDWPDMEKDLFELFMKRRGDGVLVSRGWFRKIAKQLFEKRYPGCGRVFVFSSGWFNGFLRRFNVSHRRVTKQATKLPGEYIEKVNSFLQFIRRNSQPTNPPPPKLRHIMQPNRFHASCIMNMDETPIPFEYLDGHTYDIRGNKTIGGKSERSGWDKRQATLILYIFADGSAPIKPKLIFHGKPDGRQFDKEGHLYSKDITVEFNQTAYNNEGLFIRWIEEELRPLVEKKDEDFLLVMDVAAFHKTPAILQKLRDNQITTAMIPSGCTSLLQPLDTAVNKPFKDWLREATEEYTDSIPEGEMVKWTVSDRRVMTTHVVAAAWKRLVDNSRLVQKAFTECGISIAFDGSEDHRIRIKDIPATAINFSGWDNHDSEGTAQDESDQMEMSAAGDGLEEFLVQGEGIILPKNYRILLVPQLRDLCMQRGLPTSGVKKVLVERLKEADQVCSAAI